MRTAMARGVLCALLAVGSVVSAHAGDDNVLYANLHFNLSNPGARSLALGGAFTGLADDATAAYANPAGLTQIFKPQFSLEIRHASIDTQYTSAGTYLSPPNAPPFDNPFNGITKGTQTDSGTRPSFVSLMLPHGRWAVGIYRHELANTVFHASTGTVQLSNGLTIPPLAESLTLRIVDWGAAGAFNFTDNVTLGASVSYFQNSLASTTARSEGVPFVASDSGHESSVAGNVGLLVKSGKASFGAVYHRSPAFRFNSALSIGAANINVPVDFKAPDAYGVGMVYRFSDTLYTSTDIQNVLYSQQTDPSRYTSVNGAFGDPASAYHANDATEFRIGVEKAFIRATNPTVFAVRFGGWYDPAHSIRYSGLTPSRAAVYLPSRALTHVTGGLGFVFGEYQADVGADVSTRSKAVSLSFVKSFKPFSR